jgi:transcriptional regulator with XRE-family HTH domain
MVLANRIRQIRESYHLTQSEVAYRCGISPSAYGQIERKAGKCTFETLSKIAIAIGVSLPFLIDIENHTFVEIKNKL